MVAVVREERSLGRMRTGPGLPEWRKRVPARLAQADDTPGMSSPAKTILMEQERWRARKA